MKIVVCVGLPASGKTTFARNLVSKNTHYKRINRDDLRSMIDNGRWNRGKEKHIKQAELQLAEYFLSHGFNVVVDDCNLAESAKAMWQELAKKTQSTIEIKEFDAPVEVCVERDRQRENQVGDKVIRDMARKYVATAKPPKVERDPALYDAILCDLDGTLALFGDANPYDRDFTKDEVNESVKGILDLSYEYLNIIFLSGRKEKYREQTEQWLRSHGFVYVELYMRRDDDNRKDAVVKEELYNEHIKGHYNVRAIFDDRLSVCRLWYSLGLPLFRVGNPDANF